MGEVGEIVRLELAGIPDRDRFPGGIPAEVLRVMRCQRAAKWLNCSFQEAWETVPIPLLELAGELGPAESWAQSYRARGK